MIRKRYKSIRFELDRELDSSIEIAERGLWTGLEFVSWIERRGPQGDKKVVKLGRTGKA